MFKRIDHVEIVTDPPERTVEFYTEVLGFTVRSRDRIENSPLGVPMGLVYLDLGGTTVELISYEGASVEPAPRNERSVDNITPVLRPGRPRLRRLLWHSFMSCSPLLYPAQIVALAPGPLKAVNVSGGPGRPRGPGRGGGGR